MHRLFAPVIPTRSLSAYWAGDRPASGWRSAVFRWGPIGARRRQSWGEAVLRRPFGQAGLSVKQLTRPNRV